MKVWVMPILLILLGCNQPSDHSGQGTVQSTEKGTAAGRAALPSHGSIQGRRADFLNKIRSADPQYQTIQRALINEQNELGVVLNRGVDLDQIPRLMRSLLTEMAKAFPGEDLTVIAYTPSEPPLKIGTARLDASTREMTYTPTR
jgi:hypothetical protein